METSSYYLLNLKRSIIVMCAPLRGSGFPGGGGRSNADPRARTRPSRVAGTAPPGRARVCPQGGAGPTGVPQGRLHRSFPAPASPGATARHPAPGRAPSASPGQDHCGRVDPVDAAGRCVLHTFR